MTKAIKMNKKTEKVNDSLYKLRSVGTFMIGFFMIVALATSQNIYMFLKSIFPLFIAFVIVRAITDPKIGDKND